MPRPPYLPLSGRAAAATAVLALLLVIDVVSVVSGYFEVQLLDRSIGGEDVSAAQLDAGDTRAGMLGLAQVALTIACIVTFIAWLHRAYRNMDAIAPSLPRWTPGWAIGWWFVPVLNLWRPKQIVDDAWDSDGSEGGQPLWLPAWQAGWIISGYVARVAIPNLEADPSLQELRADSVSYMVSDGFEALVLVLAIRVVRRCTKRQAARADEWRLEHRQQPA